MATAIPETYKGAVYDKPGELSVQISDLKTPEPGPGEVLIKLCVAQYQCLEIFLIMFQDSLWRLSF